MTDTRYLVHGVFWDGPPAASGTSDGGSPVLRLQQLSPGHGFSEVRLDAGARLGFRVADTGKHCLGHTKVFSESEREHVPCPDRFPAVRGSQCERCFVVDDSRLIHDFHRGGRVPPGLRSYLMQPHWLYVATFAHGASKIGTASQPRKWNRLAEQGAVVARYVALAEDGRVVRLLEDMVTREAGLAQQVRSAAKAAALTDPLPGSRLDELTAAWRKKSGRCWRAPPSLASTSGALTSWTSSGSGRRRPPGLSRLRPGTPIRTAWTAAATASPSGRCAGATAWRASRARSWIS